VTRVLGALLFLLGMLGAAWTMRAAFERKRTVGAALALAAAVLVLGGMVGAILTFVPDFLR
jgi:hypothetical protein